MFPSSTLEILSNGITLHVHLTILALFVSILNIFSSLTGKFLLPYSLMQRAQAEYNPLFAVMGKVIIEGNKSLNFLHSLFLLKLLTPYYSTFHTLAPSVSPR